MTVLVACLTLLVLPVRPATVVANPEVPIEWITPPAMPEPVRFVAVDVRIDPLGHPLAAYQIEIVADPDRVRLVGIEGGEHPAFREPPFHDPAALGGARIILAGLSTRPDLPRSSTRVATLHLGVTGNAPPRLEPRLEAAISPSGTRIPAAVTLEGAGS
jgi:hypothetical protein